MLQESISRKKKESFTDRINILFAEYQNRMSKEKRRSSEEGFAKESGLSRQCIHEYLTNTQKLPDGKSLLKLCNAHNVSADWLLALTEERSVDMDYKAAYKTLGISEKAADTLSKYRRPAFDFFLSEDENNEYWFPIISELENYYACVQYAKDNSAEISEHSIKISISSDKEYDIDIRTGITQCARDIGDMITRMLEERSYRECR